jgi:hypothetical protein
LPKRLQQSLDFGITPGFHPCASNLTLNSVPLDSATHWDFEPNFIQGSASVNASGNELTLSWFTACNSTSEEQFGARLLTVNVNSINGIAIDHSLLAGFTLTFKDTTPPELLRYSLRPISPAEIDPILYIPDIDSESEQPEPRLLIVDDDPILQGHLDDLRRLEIELIALEKAVGDKKLAVHDRLREVLLERIENCQGALCKVKAVVENFHTRFHVFVTNFRGVTKAAESLHRHATDFYHRQFPAMISSKDEKKSASPLPSEPELCHCRDGRPSDSTPPPPYDESGADDRQFKHAVSPSMFAILLRFLLAITGLALIFSLFRRCCNSPRRVRDRAARREQARREKEYKCASTRQAVMDWIRGRRRGTPGRRITDLDEKARLVVPQEAILEEHMQDEIQQLKIHEEIAHIRSARDAVDELIRAEEGRIVYPTYSPPSVPGPSYAGFTALPPPIIIPPRPHSNDSDISSPTSDLPPFSPMSRTTSLPSYRSKPPSYREEMSSNDGFSDCDMSADGEGWGSDSSVPDLSPRPSRETVRTFL